VAKKSIDLNPIKVKPNFVPSEQRRAEYKRTYERLMERAKGRVKTNGEHECHHILPKSLGGSNSKENIAVLTYKEHFLAHWLLTKFTTGKDRRSMLKALSKMIRTGKNNTNRVVSGWQYAISRRANSESQSLLRRAPEAEEANLKISETLLSFYETPEGQETLRKAGATRRAFNTTPAGQEVCKRIVARRRAFYATPEGQEARRRSDKKRGETMRARGSKAGENHHRAKFTEELVRAIRAFNGTNKEAAEYFGIRSGVIYKIRTGQRWGHVK
jgi:hypothetical protein